MRMALALALGCAASPLAAQEQMPPLAEDTLELTITSEGVVAVEPQAYHLMAWLFTGNAAGSFQPVANAAQLQTELQALSSDLGRPCLTAGRIGFIGNEVLAEDDELAVEPMLPEVEEETDSQLQEGWTVYAPGSPVINFTGIFVGEEARDLAVDLLLRNNVMSYSLNPLAFDCAQAEHSARLAAIAKSGDEAAKLAEALGMRVSGMTRVAVRPDQSPFWQTNLLDVFDAAPPDALSLHAQVEVTYRLTR